jgi:hypothetical protein
MNPYQEWLQCKSKRPHHFELLGVSPQETDVEKIRRAAASRLATVRKIRPGQHLDLWQALIDEINEAEKVLLHPETRRAYVQKLRAAIEKKKAGGGSPKSGSPSPAAVSSPHDLAAPPIPSASIPPQASEPTSVTSPTPNAPLTSLAALNPAAESVGEDTFDPMAPLTAPSSPPPQAADKAAPTAHQAGPATTVNLDSNSGGSANLAAFARRRTQRKRRKMLISGLLSLIVIGLFGTVVYLNQDTIFGSKVSEAEGGTDTDSPTPGETETDGEATETTPDRPTSPPPDGETGTNTENSNSGDNTIEPSDPESPPGDPTSDPEMEGPNDSTPGTTDPPPSDPPTEPEVQAKSLTRPEAFALGETMKAAHLALSERKFDEAEELWSSAREQAGGTDYLDLVDRLQIMGQTTRRCWDQIAKAAGQLQSSEVLEFSPTVAVAIIEASEDRLVYRVNGERQERAPKDLPPGLGKLILESVLDPGAELDTLLGALYAAEAAMDETKREQAETYWRQADAAGATISDLIQWLSDEYDLVAEDYTPEPTPDKADLDEAEATVSEELSVLIDAAKKPEDRVSTGLEIIEQATTQEATPETYVKFQKACELIAMSGQSTQLATPLELWEQWFKLDRIAVMTDLLERCSRIAADPEECQETVRQSLELAKQAVNKKEPELAERLLEAATDAAQKSKDTMTRSETLMAVRQLKERLKGN